MCLNDFTYADCVHGYQLLLLKQLSAFASVLFTMLTPKHGVILDVNCCANYIHVLVHAECCKLKLSATEFYQFFR